jgi:hypothetical protein
LRLSSTFGKFRIVTNYTERLRLVEPVPGSLRPFPGEPEPCVRECGGPRIISSYAQFTAIQGMGCRECLETYAKHRVATQGSWGVTFEGDVDDCNIALRQSEYKGDPGFNSDIPSTGDAFTVIGEQSPNFGDDKAREFIVVTAMDLGNTGCTSVDSKDTVKRSEVRLTPLSDQPFLKFFQNGDDMCEMCKNDGSCGLVCPAGTPKVYSDESVLLEFNESFSPQIRDYDTRDTSQIDARYTLYMQVLQGVLFIPSEVTLAGRDTPHTISGLTYTKGTEGCLTCSEFELSGTLFELNKAMIGLTYKPILFYNSQFGSQERLRITISQTAPAGSATISAMDVILNILSVNDRPTVNRFVHGSSASLAVKSEFYDIVFMSSSMAEYCKTDTVTCLSLTDPDACEGMYIETGIEPAKEDTVRVQAGTAPICSDMLLSAGKLRINVKCTYGNVWFFSSSEITKWPPDANLRPLRDPGKEERNLTLNKPLPEYVGGVLRYYPSTSLSAPDTVVIEIDDNGNTGKAVIANDGKTFCCCTDASCATCTPGACAYELDVSSCANVPGWLCLDSKQSNAGIPGEALTALAIAGVIVVVGVGGWIVHTGQESNAVNQEFRAHDTEALTEQKRSIAAFVHQRSLKKMGPAAHDRVDADLVAI